MSDRWVCPACSAKNHDVNYACQKCGQTRSMESTPVAKTESTTEWESGSPEAGYSETPPRKQRRGGVRWLRWWWAPIVVVGVASNAFSSDSIPRDSSGAIVSSAQMSVHDLRVGDCFDFVDAQEEEGVYEIDAVMGKNCSLLHDHEVYVVEALDMDDGYPSEFRFERIFEDICIGAFASYVGTEWEFSDVWADMFWPSEVGWTRDGDRTITCFLFLMEGQNMGSLRNSGR